MRVERGALLLVYENTWEEDASRQWMGWCETHLRLFTLEQMPDQTAKQVWERFVVEGVVHKAPL